MIDPTGREQVLEPGEKTPNAEAGVGVGRSAGILVFHVGALRWIPLEPSAQLAHAALEGYSTRSERAPQAGM